MKSSRTLGQGVHTNVIPLRVADRYSPKGQSSNDESDDLVAAENLTKDQVGTIGSSLLESKMSRTRDKTTNQPGSSLASAVGMGLKRPLELGDDGMPMMKRRRRDATPCLLQSRSMIARRSRPKNPQSSYLSSNDSNLRSRPSSSDGNHEMQHSDRDSSPDSSQDNTSSLGKSDEVDMDQDGSATDSEKHELGVDDWSHEQKPRSQSFKRWASDMPVVENGTALANYVHRIARFSPIPKQNQGIATKQYSPLETPANPISIPRRELFTVNILRTAEVALARSALPIVAEEQRIMEAIHNHPVVIICGSTGSGKTTQIPQFLYETGFGSPLSPTPGMIGITQPRRVAAVSSAMRVGEEMNNSNVAYQIRFDTTVGQNTAIKYMTDGILLREITQDFALTKYSAIVIDEAHERTTNTDLLIGMLTRIVELRMQFTRFSPLKLIIMSATLNLSDFVLNPKLFRHSSPPVVEIEGRQYPVTVHFARKTEHDYMDELYGKLCKAHERLPPGGILVFLTGQTEILTLASRLLEALSNIKTVHQRPSVRVSAKEVPLDVEDLDIGHGREKGAGFPVGNEDDETEESDSGFEIEKDAKISTNVLILPLYSQLPIEEQRRVFSTQLPQNTRLIVLATNVAETSLTISGIRYVFDCGRAKERKYDRNTGVQSFEVGWISKASANQRAGRAGRTGPGHCYRLYSSALYERDFKDHTEPEILRSPAESIVMQLKSMGMQDVSKFPFPTSPDMSSLAEAERLLKNLSALTAIGEVTVLGRELATYPLSPRFAKMLTIGHQAECIYVTIATVAALAVGDLFIPDTQLSTSEGLAQHNRNTRSVFNCGDQFSDVFSLLSALAAYSWAVGWRNGNSWCSKMGLRSKALKEAYQLWRQLISITSTNRPGLLDPKIHLVPRLEKHQSVALKQIVAAGFIDQIAIRADLAPNPPTTNRPSKLAIHMPYFTLFPSHEGKAATLDEQAVFIHASSVLANLPSCQLPKFVIYSHLQRSSTSNPESLRTPKIRMHPLVAVSGKQILTLARGPSPLLEYGKPIGKIERVIGASGLRDSRTCWLAVNLVGLKGSTGWPLPAQKVQQKFNQVGQWEVEKFLE